jgi:radical SAM superfamily enzyme YgiQ (UPF0313 family)
MELAVRKGSDRFVKPGAYTALQARLRGRSSTLAEVPTVVLSAFDRSTRLLPFVFYDSFMFPAGASAIANALHQAGFARTRAVFELWNPDFRPSRARLDGRTLEMLLISSMQIHSHRAYNAVREAWLLGDARPLIIAGGPKAIYEPYHFWPAPGTRDPAVPDVVVTGEQYVLLELLDTLLEYRSVRGTMRSAFEQARSEGALETIPGLVYLAPGASAQEPALIDTGLQRLVQDLDELPGEETALDLLEPPHRGPGLSPKPLEPARVGRCARIASLLVTQGCKFNCSYCPIPAVNQKSWRYRSPEALVRTIASIYERFHIKYFFGADDNFFNRRETAEAFLTAMARSTAAGVPFRERIRFATEATQFDTYRNRDLLPLARDAGVHALWFGIEDLTATLINKGQKPTQTIELFRLLDKHKISPMAMMMFHAGQPYNTPGALYGLYNQIKFLRKAGAVSVQCTVHSPAVGTREQEATYARGGVLRSIGSYVIPESRYDGNHVVIVAGEAAWKRQIKLLGGYAAFYNPANFVRALKRDGSPLRRRRIRYQLAGMAAIIWTAAKTMPYILRLMTGKPSYRTDAGATTIEIRHPDQAFPRWPTTLKKDRLIARGTQMNEVERFH